MLWIGENQTEVTDELAAALELDSQIERLVGGGQPDVRVALQPVQYAVFVQRHAVQVAEKLFIQHHLQQVLPITSGQAPQDQSGGFDGERNQAADFAAIIGYNEALEATRAGLNKPGILLRERNRVAAIGAFEIYETLFCEIGRA